MKPYLLFSLIISWALLSAIVKNDHQSVDHASLCTDTIPGQTYYEKALAFNDDYINQGIPQLWDSVMLYMNKAVALKHVEACAFMVNDILFNHFAYSRDTAYAMDLLLYAAHNKSALANYDLGLIMFCQGMYQDGEKLLLKSDSLGDPLALYDLSQCFTNGYLKIIPFGFISCHIPKDEKKGLYYCYLAADKGNLDAQVFMMYHYKSLHEESAFRCMVLRVLNNEDLMSEENVSTSDDIDMFLTEEYGASWRDITSMWFCE